MDNLQSVAANVAALKYVIEEVTRHDLSMPQEVEDLLRLCTTLLGGEQVSEGTFGAAANAVLKSDSMELHTSVRKTLMMSHALAVVAMGKRGWQNSDPQVRSRGADALAYLLDPDLSEDELERLEQEQSDRLNKVHADALAQAGPAREPAPKKRADLSHLGSAVAAWAASLDATQAPPSDVALADVLQERGVSLSDAVASFDARYAGIEMAPSATSSSDLLTFGACHCLQAGLAIHGARIPMATMGDKVFYVDDDGRGWDQDAVFESEPHLVAETPDALAVHAIASCFYVKQSPRGWLPGEQGLAVAKQAGGGEEIPLLPGGWGDESNLIFEQTRFGETRTFWAGSRVQSALPDE